MSNYGMVGTLSTSPDNRDTLVDILLKAADLMNDLDDCHTYIITKDAADNGKVWVIELWASKEAHDQSLSLPQVRELITQGMPLLVGQPSGASLIPVGGKGL